MAVEERRYTAEAFWEIAQLPENRDRRLELIDGVITEVAPSGQKNAVVAARIVYFLNAFVMSYSLGYVTGPDGSYTIDEHNVYQPDAAFISKFRHSELEGVEFPIAPDLAVEVVSPSERSNAGGVVGRVVLGLMAG
jgi:Uma2 family endonuclease